MRSQKPDIRSQTNQANRTKIGCIVETILLCRRHSIPLRGHCDNITDVERGTSENHGNFWALLRFRVEAGDTILGDHLAVSSRNAIHIFEYSESDP